MERCVCLIDGGYLQNVLKYFNKPEISHAKLVEIMKGDEKLLRAYYYDCPSYVSNPITREEEERQSRKDKFFSGLNKIPNFEVRKGRLEKRVHSDGKVEFIQKRVDVLIAMDIVMFSAKHLITHIKIVTGDSDLIPPIQFAKNEGIIVELFYSDKSAHNDLVLNADIKTEIDSDFIKKIEKEKSISA
ncbi:MAG: NYN domain-containing protein [Selenomonadaceae bacterium]|nr:NYN domain-containing protein [Selenomonadaceae bacterium]